MRSIGGFMIVDSNLHLEDDADEESSPAFSSF